MVRPRLTAYVAPNDLLAELMTAFGREMAPNKVGFAVVPEKLDRAAVAPSSPSEIERQRAYRRELVEAEGLLTELIARVRALLAGPLPQPDEYRERRAQIIEAWDDAIDTHQWTELPPLCRGCGKPVYARRPERDGQRVELSMVCSETCRKRVKSLRAKARRKAAPSAK